MIRTEAIDEAFQGERELGGQLCFVDDRGPRERPQPTIGVGEGEFPGEGIQESLVRGIAFLGLEMAHEAGLPDGSSSFQNDDLMRTSLAPDGFEPPGPVTTHVRNCTFDVQKMWHRMYKIWFKIHRPWGIRPVRPYGVPTG